MTSHLYAYPADRSPGRPVKAAALALAAMVAAVAFTPATARAAEDPRGAVYLDVAPMNRTVETRLKPQMAALMDRLLVEGRDMRLDGVAVFQSGDRFLPGKIAVGLASLLVDTPREDPRFARYLAGFRQVAVLTLDDPNDTWGIYYYTLALYRLQQAGLLDEAVDAQTLARLRQRLDWRSFVRQPDLTLIDLPNNYYGVAFSIARLRMLLGWEDASASEALLAKTLVHYRTYSGEFGFADETEGQGRYDRYSVLLIGEIAQRFIEIGMEPPAEVKVWLRKSVELMLPRFNLRGEGFEYGRSLGPYGETAFLEVLTAAAALGVLSPEETQAAYAFSSRVTARYADFWLDPATGSVNLWDGGRRTDAYRGKHRILGENLSLGRQHLYTNDLWNRLGFKDKAPSGDFAAWLDDLPPMTVTWFARGAHDRLLVTRRDRGRVIGLPLVNGAAGQHMNSPYYPVPFSPGMLAGVADGVFPHLVPHFTLSDGAVLAPLAYARAAAVRQRGRSTVVSWRQDALDRLGAEAPQADPRLSVRTTYVLAPGRITRTDVYTPRGTLAVDRVVLEFASFSDGPTVRGGTVRFQRGDAYEWKVDGLDACRAEPRDPTGAYDTPNGPTAARVICASDDVTLTRPLTVTWTLKYR